MGILNTTPDSFYDGNRYPTLDDALIHAEKMIKSGADILDIGGESSRPGALPISIQEELDRVLPLIERLHQEFDICLSIDTIKPEVMAAAVKAGVGMINDINALAKDHALETVAQLDVPVCLMHMQGSPSTMQNNPHYEHLLADIDAFFNHKLLACWSVGLQKKQVLIDPGFGFGKTVAHNLQLMNHLNYFKTYQLPIVLGVSRKTTIGVLLNKPVEERLIGSLAFSMVALMRGVSILRTHDVEETKQVLTIYSALENECYFNSVVEL